MSEPGVPPPPPTYDPPPPPSGAGPQSSDRTMMLVLSYLGLLALIPLLTKKEDREVQWHAKHGLVLFGAFIAAWFLFQIITYVLPSEISCLLGCLPWLIIWGAYIAVVILCISKALKGERFIIPGLSDFANKF
jgi:uncharacterized membrane protein